MRTSVHVISFAFVNVSVYGVKSERNQRALSPDTDSA
jgi:hypothetical protein